MESTPATVQMTLTEDQQILSPTLLEVICAHLICPLGIALALGVAHNFFSVDLVSEPAFTLRILWVFQCPIVMLVYSRFRIDPEQCSFFRAAARGALILPFGALVNAFGAVSLGAPIGIQCFWKTIHWSAFLSSLTFLPAACAVGSSWKYWHSILSWKKSDVVVDNLIRIPTHGAIIGAWFGTWPMPLDWERPWQEWPICVTYGAITGYLAASLISLVITALDKPEHAKQH